MCLFMYIVCELSFLPPQLFNLRVWIVKIETLILKSSGGYLGMRGYSMTWELLCFIYIVQLYLLALKN